MSKVKDDLKEDEDTCLMNHHFIISFSYLDEFLKFRKKDHLFRIFSVTPILLHLLGVSSAAFCGSRVICFWFYLFFLVLMYFSQNHSYKLYCYKVRFSCNFLFNMLGRMTLIDSLSLLLFMYFSNDMNL